MTLIEKVASLQAMEKKATGSKWYDAGCCTLAAGCGDDWEEIAHPENCWNVPFLAELRNAAPDLLEVLAGFREGDAKHLGAVLDLVRFAGKCDSPPWDLEKEVLERYVAMARLMEASSK